MECCKNEIELLKENFEKKKCEARELKETYQNLLVENLQKDVIIRQLKEKLCSKKFTSFKGILTDSCLDKLKSIGHSQQEDSKFVDEALNDLYQNNVTALKKKTLTGRSKNGEKSLVSPEKINILSRLFDERISYIPSGEVNDLRAKNLSKLIRNSIDKAKRKK